MADDFRSCDIYNFAKLWPCNHKQNVKYWGITMKLSIPHSSGRRDDRYVVPACRAGVAALVAALLAGCEQNSFVPPPPPKVEVAAPVQRPVTRYLAATGNTAPIKTVDLVARVQGFLQSIDYQDGAFVKEGTPLFQIEP